MRGGSTSLVQNLSCLVAKNGYVFAAVSPAEMNAAFHRLLKRKGCFVDIFGRGLVQVKYLNRPALQ